MKMAVVVMSLISAAFCHGADIEPRPSQPGFSPIIRLASEAGPDGAFSYVYETGNGIKADARGVFRGYDGQDEVLAVEGAFSFVSDDGQTYSVTYVADENGFQPQGAHLPTPPPIPEAIRRALEWNAAHPEEDDIDYGEVGGHPGDTSATFSSSSMVAVESGYPKEYPPITSTTAIPPDQKAASTTPGEPPSPASASPTASAPGAPLLVPEDTPGVHAEVEATFISLGIPTEPYL